MHRILRAATAGLGVTALGLTGLGISGAGAAAPASHARTSAMPKGYTITTSGPADAPSGTDTAAEASCPPGTSVLGGGVFIDTWTSATNVNASYPVGSTAWGGEMSNTGGFTAVFYVYAMCANTPKAYAIEQSTVDNPAGAHTSGSTACPVKTKVLGGGAVSSSTDPRVNLGSSYPVGPTGKVYGWEATVNNGANLDDQMTVYTVCGKERGWSMSSGAALDNPAGTGTANLANCPANAVAIGGGSESSSTDLLVNLVAIYPYGNQGWVALENNDGVGDNQITPWAICAT